MPALVILISEDLEKLTSSLIKQKGYQPFVSGLYPSEAQPGDTLWPIKDELPVNTLYHPEQSAKECGREIYSWARFNQYLIDKVIAFETVNYFVISEQASFDNDKPGIKLEDFKNKAGKPE